MIFSTDKCPICNNNLKLDIIDGTKAGTFAFMYSCSTKALVRNESDTVICSIGHYDTMCYQDTEISFMLIPPYRLTHSAARKTTSVRQVSAHKSAKLIFETTLLDWDYSDPQAVVSRLKKLVPFS